MMNAAIFFLITIGFVLIGVIKGLNPERKSKNSVVRTIYIVIFSLGCVGVISIFVLGTGQEAFAEYWIKEKKRVVLNPGDGDYYLDLGDDYYKMHHFYSSDFEKLQDDTCVVYRPGPCSIWWGLVQKSASNNPDDW